LPGFVKVANATDISDGTMKNFEIAGHEFLVANVHGKYYAIGSRCTHAGGPLAEETLDGQIVQCPWHGSRFDVTTGAVVGSPARTPEQKYEVKLEGQDILVKV